MEAWLTWTMKYMILIGTTMAMNIGVAIATTRRVVNTVKKVMMKERMERGIVSSMIFTSFENLLRMRPIGVVSKKDMGERRMLCNILSCRDFEAKKVAKAIPKDERNIKSP